MSQWIGTFPGRAEFDKARAFVAEHGISWQVIESGPAYEHVGAPAVAVGNEGRSALAEGSDRFLCSGWVEYRPAAVGVPDGSPPDFAEDVFGKAIIVVLSPCVADMTKNPGGLNTPLLEVRRR